MYSERENFLRTLKGDSPDSIVVQWGPLTPIMNDACNKFARGNRVRGTDTIDRWGTHIHWPEDQVAAMPHVTEESKVLKDITHWRDYVNVPDLRANCTDWEDAKALKASFTEDQMSMCFMGTGMFEQLHYLMGFEDTLCNFLVEPDHMHDLLDTIMEYRMTYARLLIENLQPDAILSHDDWGAKTRLFMSPEIWREFFKERYKKFYDIFHENNVLVIHHADSHCEDIVEDMVDIGIDIWQGVLPQNDIVKIQKQLNGRMTLMGGIDAAIVDRADTTREEIFEEVFRVCKEYVPGGHFIPCLPNGLRNGAIFPQTDPTIDEAIREYNEKYYR